MKVKIEVTVDATLARVWSAWTTPTDIVQWNFASPEWCCPAARLDLREGGTFSYRMEAKDGSMGFDFEGEFTTIDAHSRIEYALGDGRMVSVEFHDTGDGISVVETFDAEDEHSAEQQRQGWQAILGNFKRHVASRPERER